MRLHFMRLCKVFFFLVSATVASAQEPEYRAPQGLNNWYVEIGGPAILGSINYEKYLYRTYSEKYTWCAHVGAGYNPVDFDILNAVTLQKNSFLFPFSTSILKGAGKEKLEVGGGFTLMTENFSTSEFFPHAVIGMRVMESNKICFRLNYVPIFKSSGMLHWIGISLGKNFSFK